MKTVNYIQPGPVGYATVPATSDAKEYLRLLIRHKWGILATLLLGALLAWLYLISTTATYEASTLFELRDDEIFEQERTPVWTPVDVVKEETNILRSRRVLQPVIDANDLRNSVAAQRVPVLGALAERFPALGNWLAGLDFARHYSWSDDRIEVASLDVPPQLEDELITLTAVGGDRFSLALGDQTLLDSAAVGQNIIIEEGLPAPLQLQLSALEAREGVQFNLSRQSLSDGIARLNDAMSIESAESTSRMLTVKVQWDDPEVAARLANQIVQQYSETKFQTKTRGSNTEQAKLEELLPQYERALRDAEAALAQFRTSRNMVSEQQVSIWLGQLDILEREMTEMQIERDEFREKYTNIHPDTRKLDKEIGILQGKINALRGRIGGQPELQRELTVREQEVEKTRNNYNEVSDRLDEIRREGSTKLSSVQVVDAALAPRRAVAPKPALALVGATLASLFLYVLFLTLRSALSTVISDQESLERATGLPVYMNIPKSTAQRRLATPAVVDPKKLLPGNSDGNKALAKAVSGNVLALSKPDDYSIENLRGLRSMLDDMMSNADNNVLMFTSPLPGMGKSFVSQNLAVLIAQSGKRVLLIDADYQRGQLHKVFNLNMGPGLPEVVRGKSELKETVKPTAVPNLYLIPRGFTGGAVGQEMPGEKEFAAFLDVVAPRFDICIIDTPPVLSVSTAATLGRHAGSTILIVKEGEAKEPQIAESLKRLSFSGVRVSGTILNGSSAAAPKHYTYYREQLD